MDKFTGAFISIPLQTEIRERISKSCSKHGFNHSDNFCPKCGEEIKSRKISFKYNLSLNTIIGKHNLQTVYGETEMFFYSNFEYKAMNREKNEVIIIDKTYIDRMISNFKENHKSEIEALEAFLKTSLTVHFGFFHQR